MLASRGNRCPPVFPLHPGTQQYCGIAVEELHLTPDGRRHTDTLGHAGGYVYR